MKKLTLIVTVIALVAVLYARITFVPEENNDVNDYDLVLTDEVKEYDSNRDLDFLKIEKSNENIVYSPLSIKNAVYLLEYGAVGDTYTQISDVFGNVHPAKYENIPDVMSLPNAVFIRDTFSVNQKYADLIQEDIGAEIIQDSFESTETLDNWVAEKTFNLIPDSGIKSLDSSNMVLSNALAIQMEWNGALSDYTMDFVDFEGNEYRIEAIRGTTTREYLKYYIGEDVTVVSLELKEYEGTQLEYVVIMPGTEDLNDFIDRISMDDINGYLNQRLPSSYHADGVRLTMPKFKYDASLNLIEDFKTLGITDVFDEYKANLTNIYKSDAGNLYVSDIIHKSTIETSEDGIKAAAITEAVLEWLYYDGGPSREPEPLIIDIDHPFMYIVRDKETGENWFVGVVYRLDPISNN